MLNFRDQSYQFEEPTESRLLSLESSFFIIILFYFYDYFYQGKPSRFWINVEFKFPGKNWSEFIKSKDAENRDIEKQV